MKKIKFLAMLLIITAIATSCKKEGPAGPAGTNGTNGTNGNANITYSAWLPFNAANWSDVINEYGKNTRQYYDTVPEITQSIVDGGVVMVYFKAVGLPNPQPLPMIVYHLTSAINYSLTFRISNGLLTLVLSDLDDTNDPGVFTGDTSIVAYRYIIIPGGVLATMGAKNPKTMTYKEVCTKFNIAK